MNDAAIVAVAQMLGILIELPISDQLDVLALVAKIWCERSGPTAPQWAEFERALAIVRKR